MRPDVQATHTNIGTASKVVRFGLDPNSTAHLISLLTDLYSDRVGAAVRELLTNAIDSHLSAKVNRPVEITLPSSTSENSFSIEDFGLGLSLDELEEVYSLYGASTKRQDDEVGGLLGLGSKSPLTYTDAFTVTATQDGRRVFSQVSKDEDGVPALRVLGETEIDAPNGVKVDIPVRQFDTGDFAEAVRKYTRFLHPGTVLVDGERPANLWDEDEVIWLDDEVAIKKENGYGTSSYIVQHNVPYPIPDRRLNIPGYKVFAFVPTRTVSFTPSREALDFNEKTIDVVDTLKAYVNERLYTKVLEEFEEATPFGQLQIVRDWRQKFPKIAQELFGRKDRYDGFKSSRTHLGLERSYWVYDAGVDRASKGNASISWLDFLDCKPIVIGYPNKTVTALNRVRLEEYFTTSRIIRLLPGEPSLKPIDGYPGTIVHWDDIVAATPNAKVARQNNSSGSSATEYGLYQGGTRQYLTIAEIKDLKEEGEIVNLAYSVTGDKSHWPNDAEYLSHYHVLAISDRQIDKIQRTFKGIQDTTTILRGLREAARKRLSRDDYVQIAIRRHVPLLFRAFRNQDGFLEQIEDADLRHLIGLTWGERSKAVERVQRLGDNPPEPEEVEEEVAAEVREFEARYPLFHSGLIESDIRRMPLEDIVLYLNSKYQTITSKTGGEEAA